MKLITKIFTIIIPLIVIFIVLTIVYGKCVDFSKILIVAVRKFPSFLFSSAAIVPAVIIAYKISKYSILKKNRFNVLDSLASDLPVFVIAVILQIFIWSKFFLISSYHSVFFDVLSSFIPTFLTFLLTIFIQFRISMYPIVIRLKKEEFVKTYKSVGMSEIDINKRLSRNIDVEMSKSVKGVILMSLGESLVVENLYNFRGIGYEILKSLRESDVTTVAGLLVYIVLLLFVLSIIMERDIPE